MSASSHPVSVDELGKDRGRVVWVDTAKGFGIILVVVGHVLRGLGNGHLIAWTEQARFVDAWIYAFHMPLFFFLSGLFLAQSSAKSSGAFVSDKLRTIAYPYFVWSIITLCLKASLGSIPNQPRELSEFVRIFYSPIEQYWFFYVLFFLTLPAGLILKFRIKPRTLFLWAILIYPGLLPPLGWWILDLARSYAWCLALGVLAGGSWSLQRYSGIRLAVLTVVAVLGLAMPALFVAAEMSEEFAIRPLLAASGTAGAVALALLASKANLDGLIRIFGRYALQIFVAHTIASAAVRVLLVKYIFITAPELHLVLGTLAGLYVPIALSRACEKVGFRVAFTLPKFAKSEGKAADS